MMEGGGGRAGQGRAGQGRARQGRGTTNPLNNRLMRIMLIK